MTDAESQAEADRIRAEEAEETRAWRFAQEALRHLRPALRHVLTPRLLRCNAVIGVDRDRGDYRAAFHGCNAPAMHTDGRRYRCERHRHQPISRSDLPHGSRVKS